MSRSPTARQPVRSSTISVDEKFPSEITHAHSPRVFGLDLLRAIAILSVVVAHYSVVIYDHMPWWYGLIGHGGFYGVELFFVLSGFLIGRILLRSEQQLAQPSGIAVFYVRRWFRTLPLFWLFIAVNVLLEFFLRDRRLTLTEILGHGFFLQNFAALKMSFFGESWSLAVEEWFYLLFPFALWLGLKIWKRFDTVFLLTAATFFLFSTVARMLSAPHPNASWTDWQRMVVIYRFDALMIGVFAAWLALRFPTVWRARSAIGAFAGLVLLIGMYTTLWKFSDHHLAQGADSYFARTFRFTFVSVGFALLLPLASNWKLNRENLASLTIRRIALWSYALYLVHMVVYQIVTKNFFREWKTAALQGFASFALQIAAAITISALLYRFYESRCTHLRDKVAPQIVRLGRHANAAPAKLQIPQA